MPARSRPLTHYRRGPELAVFPDLARGPDDSGSKPAVDSKSNLYLSYPPHRPALTSDHTFARPCSAPARSTSRCPKARA